MSVPTLSPKDAWLAALGQLQLQLNRPTFDTWLKGSEVLSYEDGDFVIRVRHAYAKDWLEKHLDHLVTRTLGDIWGRSVRVNYTVFPPSRPPVDTAAGPLFAGQPGSAPGGDPQDNRPTPDDTSGRFHDKTSGGAPQNSENTQHPGGSNGHAEQLPANRAALQTTIDPQAGARSDYSEWDPRLHDLRRTTSSLPAIEPVTFDPRYTFEGFITGPSNHFACAAALAVAQAEGQHYNPLVIYGGTGLGKTHLLQAIGQTSQTAGRRVLYVTGEDFTNEVIEAIQAHKTADLRDRYRRVDVLLVDDVQFMAGKPKTEEEFYHTFNAIFSRGGQIVVASNQHPRDLDKLDDRLRSRFQGGLLADIQPPEFETRIAILHIKSRAQAMALPDDVASALALHETENVRALEGLLTQVLARATLTRQPLTLALAQEAIHKTGGGRSPLRRRVTSVEQILETTATFHQLSLDDLLSKRRTKDVVRARQIVMYLAREETDASLPQIGLALGGRNHSTVLHGYQKIAEQVETDSDLLREVTAIRRQLRLFPD